MLASAFSFPNLTKQNPLNTSYRHPLKGKTKTIRKLFFFLYPFYFQLFTFNFILKSIPKATNRITEPLTRVVSGAIVIVVNQSAIPPVRGTVLRRTPHVTALTNEVVFLKVVAARANSTFVPKSPLVAAKVIQWGIRCSSLLMV